MRATATTTTTDPPLFWFIVSRGVELELRRRRNSGEWRFICPADASHEVTIVNGNPGLALTCHGPCGADSPGHALSVHRRLRCGDGIPRLDDIDRHPDLYAQPYPCRWCGCAESQILAAFGARPKDKFRQKAEGACVMRGCYKGGYRMSGKRLLCLAHLVDASGIEHDVIFGDGPE
jgi:hypothetical protein